MKDRSKIKGFNYKITHFLVVYCSKVTNLISKDAKTQYSLPYVQYERNLILIFMILNENISNG